MMLWARAFETHTYAHTPIGLEADILEMPDGALLVSDDRAGVIYRISYSESEA